MIEQSAIVQALQHPFAVVEVQRESSCGSCQVSKGCGTATIARLFPQRSQRLLALNPVEAKPGEQVVVGLDESALGKASLMLYLTPLLGLIAGAIGGEWLGNALGGSGGELPGLLGGLLGILAGFYWARTSSRRYSRDPRFQPVILRVNGGSVVQTVPVTGLAVDKSNNSEQV